MFDSVPNRCIFHQGDRINNQYQVIKPLGEGTFGSVYKVQDAQGSVYALKLLKLWEVSPEERTILINRFNMEYETGRIQSNYLVHSHQHGIVEGNPYIVMEFCPNGDLRDKKHLNPDQLVQIAMHILYGLRDLHRNGKIHRDLKPDNVLFRADGTAILTDFGISGDQNKRMTERGWLGKPKQIFGTYGYMPPEQVRPPRGGKATVLPTTDIFSFGVMMYELLVGHLPFGELTIETLMQYVDNSRNGIWDRRALQNVRGNIDWLQIIEGCLVPNFQNRLQTAEEVLALFPSHNNYNHPSSQRQTIGKMRLRVMQGEQFGNVYVLDNLLFEHKALITIGRKDQSVHNDIAIIENDTCYVSRKHCTIECNKSKQTWYIREGQWDKNATNGWTNSTNGTFINSTEVPIYGIQLHNEDIISIGDVKLRVEIY